MTVLVTLDSMDTAGTSAFEPLDEKARLQMGYGVCQ